MPSSPRDFPFDERLLQAVPDPLQIVPAEAHFSRDVFLRIVRCLDLTSLGGYDSAVRIQGLCQDARGGIAGAQPAAVCVYPVFVPTAREALAGTAIRVATVAGAFPHALSPLAARVEEVRQCALLGADEIDIVIRRDLANEGQWEQLHLELSNVREAAGSATLKVILATGELRDRRVIFQAAMAAMMAGADFVKTSTGKEAVNATIEAGEAMIAAIKVFNDATGRKVGLKPAGGIRTAEEAAKWLGLVERRLGEEWTHPSLFRIGASGLYGDLKRVLSA